MIPAVLGGFRAAFHAKVYDVAYWAKIGHPRIVFLRSKQRDQI